MPHLWRDKKVQYCPCEGYQLPEPFISPGPPFLHSFGGAGVCTQTSWLKVGHRSSRSSIDWGKEKPRNLFFVEANLFLSWFRRNSQNLEHTFFNSSLLRCASLKQPQSLYHCRFLCVCYHDICFHSSDTVNLKLTYTSEEHFRWKKFLPSFFYHTNL